MKPLAVGDQAAGTVPSVLGGKVALVIGEQVDPLVGAALDELGARTRLASSENAALDVASTSAPPLVLVELADDEHSTARMGQAVADRSPSSKLVLLGNGDSLHAAVWAARAGFHGYVAGDASPGQVNIAIRAALEDHFVVPRRIAQATFDVHPLEQERAEALAAELTAREWEVLELLTEGQSNREIGAALSISPHTVRAHIGKILGKLEARDRLEAATFAMRYKLISRDRRSSREQ
jgi:DNA-binding NarL/FixJ family response regulator